MADLASRRFGHGSTVFSPKIINTMLDHIDENAGPESIYIVQKGRAKAELAELIAAHHPAACLSSQQIRKKLDQLTLKRYQRHPQQSTNDLFTQGSSALKTDYLIHLGRRPRDRTTKEIVDEGIHDRLSCSPDELADESAMSNP